MFYSAAFFRIKFKAVHTEFWIVSSGQGMFYSSIHGFSFLRRHDKKRSFVSNYCGASQKLVTKLFCLLFTVCPSFFILSVYKKLYIVWFMAVLFFIYKEDFCHCLFIYYICVISIWTCFVLLYSCVSDFCSFSCFSLSFSFLYQQPLLLSFVSVFIVFFILTVFFCLRVSPLRFVFVLPVYIIYDTVILFYGCRSFHWLSLFSVLYIGFLFVPFIFSPLFFVFLPFLVCSFSVPFLFFFFLVCFAVFFFGLSFFF